MSMRLSPAAFKQWVRANGFTIGIEFRNTPTPRTDLTNDITARSQFSVNGTVQINHIGVDPNAGLVNLPVELTDPRQQIAQGCGANQGSSFVVTGRGGMIDNPIAQVVNYHPWADLRSLTPDRHPVTPMPSPLMTAQPLVEATGWRRNPNGELELFAERPTTPVPKASAATCAAALAKPL